MARFIGGPLNGQQYDDATAASVAAAFNETYKPDRYERRADGNYYWGGFSPPPSTAVPGKSDALRAAKKVQTVLARDIPKYVARSRRARARFRRMAR